MPGGKHMLGTIQKPGLRHCQGGGPGTDRHSRRKHAGFFGISPGDTLLILGNEVSGLVVTKPQVLSDLADEILGNRGRTTWKCDHV